MRAISSRQNWWTTATGKYPAVAKLDAILDTARLDAATTTRAILMKESLATTMKSVEITMAGIESDLASGQIVRARNRVTNLENLLGDSDDRLAALKANAPAGDKIVKAWESYLTHRLIS